MRSKKEDYGVCRNCGLKECCPKGEDCRTIRIINGTESITNFSLKFNPDRKHKNKK